MTEAEWNACADPQLMLEFLRGRAGDRKVRLFGCACCRRIWRLLPDEANRDLVAAVEDRPEGAFDDPELYEAICASSRREYELLKDHAFWAAKYLGRTFYKFTPLSCVAEVCRRAALRVSAGLAGGGEGAAQAVLLREVFGNPFRPPPAIAPAVLAWEGGTVVNLARLAYEERQLPSGELDPQRLAVLADALEEAGCMDDAVLGHLRGPGPHVRGCFAVDWILGKS